MIGFPFRPTDETAHVSMKVIGAGFGRTGTLSLKFALEKLGFDKCYHMMEVMLHPEHATYWAAAHRGEAIDWDALLDGYQASVDWPSCNLWREQLAKYPSAKVLLSRRDPDRWYDSVMATIYQSTLDGMKSDDPARRAHVDWINEIIWNRVFDGRMDDRAHVTACFEAHNQSVIDEVPPEKLLVYEPGQGWEPICSFLNVAVPDEEYPRVNTREEFPNIFKSK